MRGSIAPLYLGSLLFFFMEIICCGFKNLELCNVHHRCCGVLISFFNHIHKGGGTRDLYIF